MKRTINDFYFSYKEYGSEEWITIPCDKNNTVDNGDGTATIIKVPNINIESGFFKVFSNQNIEVSSSQERFYDNIGVPRIDITITNEELINKDTKVSAQMSLSNSLGGTYSDANLYSGNVKIKYRGNSTFYNSPKHPYTVSLVDQTGKDLDVPLLKMGSAKDWVLLAEWFDYTLLKSKMAFDISDSLSNMLWTPKAHSVELYVNGDYRGVYSLVEKIERDKNKVNVMKMSSSDNVLPNLSGGYLLEQVNTQQEDPSVETLFTTPKTINMEYPYLEFINISQRIEYPKFGSITNDQKNYISNYVNDFENSLYNIDFSDLQNGYRSYIDVDSAIDYYLIKELTKGPDSVGQSLWYFKERSEKMKIGIPWDFDISMGSFIQTGLIESTGLVMAQNVWFKKMLQDQYFVAKLKSRYSAVRSDIIAGINNFKVNSNRLIFNQASTRNFQKWDILNTHLIYTQYQLPGTYEGEIERVYNWIMNRVFYFDQQFN